MRVVLTGSSGFLGRRVLGRLLVEGHDVVVLARAGPSAVPAGARVVEADLTDESSLVAAARAIGAGDVLVHLAAAVPRTPSQDALAAMLAVNTLGTAQLLRSFMPVVDRAVVAGSAEVYGPVASGGPIAESAVPMPRTAYGISKLAAEHAAAAVSRLHDRPVSCLRFTVLYGAGDEIDRAIPNFVRRAVSGLPPQVFGGEELRDYLPIDEAARAVVAAALVGASGSINIGSGCGTSVLDVARSISALVDPRLGVEVLPRRGPAVDIVLDVARAEAELGFRAVRRFPGGLDELVACRQDR
jgi:nucleoside-diphosphate-sugar epimerase